MSNFVIRLLIAFSFILCLVSCSESQEITPESELFPQKLKERIVLQRYENTVDRREVKYRSGSDTIQFETIYLRNGNIVNVTYNENEIVSKIVEYYAPDNKGDLLRVRRNTIVDETGLTPTSDVLYRRDGTIELTGKSIEGETIATYEVLKFNRDGKKVKHKRVLKKYDDSWLTFLDEMYYQTGKVRIKTERLKDKTYKREAFTESEVLQKSQIWNPDRTLVKTTFFADDGTTVTYIVTETAAQRSILYYNASGFIKQMKDTSGDSESITMYDDKGNALFSQSWLHERKSSNGTSTSSLIMVDVLRSSDSISKKYYFFPTTHTLQFLIEQSETEKDGWRKRTRIYNEDGWLTSDQTINQLNKVVDNKTIKKKSIRYPNMDNLFLMYRPLKDPPPQLSDQWWKD